MRARPRFNKDEVDDEDDVVDDDAIRCKVLGETDDDDFRNKTRAMADIYIFLELPLVQQILPSSSLLVCASKKREERENAPNTSSLLFSAAFAKVFRTSIIIFNNHNRSID